jgi:mRNA interferase RelE/StbE
MYEVKFKSQAVKFLRKLQPKQATRIRAAINELAEDPAGQKLDVKPLSGREGFRLRVGNYRILYDRFDDLRIIAIERIGSRGDVY